MSVPRPNRCIMSYILSSRPPNTAVGTHTDYLPLVVTCTKLSQARLADRLNSEVICNLCDPEVDDPTELLTALRRSKVVSKVFASAKKIYGVKIGLKTGIFVDVNW